MQPEVSVSAEFALSFERIALESVSQHWNTLQAIQVSIDSKRSMQAQLSSEVVAAMKRISSLNDEAAALEAQFHAVLSTLCNDRTRTQDKLRMLVQEWEKSKVVEGTRREREIKREHDVLRRNLEAEVSRLNLELHEKVELVALQRNEIHSLNLHGTIAGGTSMTLLTSDNIEQHRNERTTVSDRMKTAELSTELAATKAESAQRLDRIKALEETMFVQPGDQNKGEVASSSFFTLQKYQEGSTKERLGTPKLLTCIGLELSNRRQQVGLSGVYVKGVSEAGPAFQCGIRCGDVIVSWATRPVRSVEDIATCCRSFHPNSNLSIGFYVNPPMHSDLRLIPHHCPLRVATIFVENRLFDGRKHT